MSNRLKAGLSYRNPLPDAGLLIAMGVWAGVSHINKFGRNPSIASGASEDVWDGSATYVFPATALMTRLSQTTNQAALLGETIEIQGLDANWEASTEQINLDGVNTTTAVVLVTPLIRVNRMEIQSSVVADSTVRLHNTAENQDYAVIVAGNQQTSMAVYTVPLGKTAYMENYYATVNPGGGAPTTMDIKLWTKDNGNGYAKKLKHEVGLDLDANNHILQDFHPYKKFTEKTDIFLEATTVGATADVSGGFDLILVDTDLYT